MKSLVIKRSIVVAGHKTSVSLEEAFWNALIGFSTWNSPISAMSPFAVL